MRQASARTRRRGSQWRVHSSSWREGKGRSNCSALDSECIAVYGAQASVSSNEGASSGRTQPPLLEASLVLTAIRCLPRALYPPRFPPSRDLPPSCRGDAKPPLDPVASALEAGEDYEDEEEGGFGAGAGVGAAGSGLAKIAAEIDIVRRRSMPDTLFVSFLYMYGTG